MTMTTWETRTSLEIINKMRDLFPTSKEGINITKEIHSYVDGDEEYIYFKYWFSFGEIIQSFKTYNALLTYVGKIICEHDLEYKKRMQLKRHEWDKYFKEN